VKLIVIMTAVAAKHDHGKISSGTKVGRKCDFTDEIGQILLRIEVEEPEVMTNGLRVARQAFQINHW
jgi:hypothetical protein